MRFEILKLWLRLLGSSSCKRITWLYLLEEEMPRQRLTPLGDVFTEPAGFAVHDYLAVPSARSS